MPEQKEFNHGHALIIGVGSDLPNTVQDATGLAEIITDPERCAYPPSQVSVLTETTATRQHVLDKLDALAKTVGPEETLIFYFSGHGCAVNIEAINMKEYYLMPYGYNQADLPNTTISRPELMQKLNAINAKKQLILFDCCHASGLDDLEPETKSAGLTVTKSSLPQVVLDEFAQGSGRVIISSCKANELSYAGKPYSQFTQALIEGFAGNGASKQDGFVLAADLATYAAKTVPSYTRNRQNPALNFSNADNFAVAYYAAGASAPKGLPQSAQRQPDSALVDTPTDALTATQSGSGNTQIVGDSNVVAGERGVVVGGNASGNIVTGDGARVIDTNEYVESVNTGGGAYVGGGVSTGGGDFVGRDKNVGGDEIGGDRIDVGNISDSTGVAIGRGAQSHVNTQSGGDVAQLISALQPILMAAQNAPVDQQTEAVETAAALKDELSKADESDDGKVGDLIDKLGGLLPGAASVFSAAFGHPVLAGVVGPITKHFLKKYGIDV